MSAPAQGPGCCWPPAPANCRLAADEVQVWCASLEPPPEVFGTLAEVLCEGERRRAERFHFARDRKRFTAGRGILRTILGRHLGLEPSRLHFAYGPQGKPALAGTAAGSDLQFNLSHSADLALVAVTLGREIGVDLEYARALPDADEIARRTFSRREVADLRALPPEERTAGFFACWTRKEAYIKARGEGMTRPLDLFSVSVAAREPARLLEVLDRPEDVEHWSFRALDPAPGYAAALAVSGHGWRLACYQWSGP